VRQVQQVKRFDALLMMLMVFDDLAISREDNKATVAGA
jgi:hypothetical protein